MNSQGFHGHQGVFNLGYWHAAGVKTIDGGAHAGASDHIDKYTFTFKYPERTCAGPLASPPLSTRPGFGRSAA